MVPHLIETRVEGVRRTEKILIEKVVVNPPLDASRFASHMMSTMQPRTHVMPLLSASSWRLALRGAFAHESPTWHRVISPRPSGPAISTVQYIVPAREAGAR